MNKLQDKSISHQQAKIILAICVAATVILYFIPFGFYIAYPFMLISTLAHEMGHGIASLLVGGNFHYFIMHMDGSGLASISGDYGRFAQGFVAAGGLIGPPMVAFLLFLLAKTAKVARFSLMAISFLLILTTILVVRNWFGVLFVLSMAVLSLFVGSKKSGYWAQVMLLFIATQLSLSVYSRSDYLFTKNAHTATGIYPSDVEQIAQALVLPYWFWGGIIAVFSLILLFYGFKNFLKNS